MGKSNMRNSKLTAKRFLSVGFAALCAPLAYANPEGGTVQAGSATITDVGNTLTVNQASDRAVIDWRSFNIDIDETTRFNQPSASAVTLNRITGDANPSQILGNLSANGQIVLVNPNGIVFGKGAVVDASALIATTSNITNNDFMAGRMNFTGVGAPGTSIVNNGNVTIADHGLAALVAPNVTNDGVINARLGKVTLAGGERFELDLYGDGLVNFVLDAAADAGEDVIVSNSGRISASGGLVALTAGGARDAVNGVVNMDGIIEANTVEERGGRIVLSAADVSVTGEISAVGADEDQLGGRVNLIGAQNTVLTGEARINVSGTRGGGEAIIGGEPGLETLLLEPYASSNSVLIDDTAIINSDATVNGNGGKIIVWSDKQSVVHGLLSARGAGGGEGGFIETSSAKKLILDGAVDVGASSGRAGEWLLDPQHLIVESVIGSTSIAEVSGTATEDNTSRILSVSLSDSLDNGGNVSISNYLASDDRGYNVLRSGNLRKQSDLVSDLFIESSGDILIDSDVFSTGGQMNVYLRAKHGSIIKQDAARFETGGGNIEFSFKDDLLFRNIKRSGDVVFDLNNGGQGDIHFSALTDSGLTTDRFLATHGLVFNGEDALILNGGSPNSSDGNSLDGVGLLISYGNDTLLLLEKTLVLNNYSVMVGYDLSTGFGNGNFNFQFENGSDVAFGSVNGFDGIPEYVNFENLRFSPSVRIAGLDGAIESYGFLSSEGDDVLVRYSIVGSGSVITRPEIINYPPRVENDISDMEYEAGANVQFTTPTNIFSDNEGLNGLVLSITGLPFGLSATDNGNGTITISGEVNQSGDFAVIVTATDAFGQTTQNRFAIKVNDVVIVTPPPVVPTDMAPTVNASLLADTPISLGQAINYPLPAALFDDDNGRSNLTVSVSGLPSGMSFTDNGNGTANLTGSPTQTGGFPLVITATDAQNQTASAGFTLIVNGSVVPLDPPVGDPVASVPISASQDPVGSGFEIAQSETNEEPIGYLSEWPGYEDVQPVEKNYFVEKTGSLQMQIALEGARGALDEATSRGIVNSYFSVISRFVDDHRMFTRQLETAEIYLSNYKRINSAEILTNPLVRGQLEQIENSVRLLKDQIVNSQNTFLGTLHKEGLAISTRGKVWKVGATVIGGALDVVDISINANEALKARNSGDSVRYENKRNEALVTASVAATGIVGILSGGTSILMSGAITAGSMINDATENIPVESKLYVQKKVAEYDVRYSELDLFLHMQSALGAEIRVDAGLRSRNPEEVEDRLELAFNQKLRAYGQDINSELEVIAEIGSLDILKSALTGGYPSRMAVNATESYLEHQRDQVQMLLNMEDLSPEDFQSAYAFKKRFVDDLAEAYVSRISEASERSNYLK